MKKETPLAQIKRLEIEQRKLDMYDTQQHLIIDKIYALKAILVGAVVDPSKPYPSSETSYLPMIYRDDEIDIIREKIMELVKQM